MSLPLTRLRYELRAFGSYLRMLLRSVLGAVAAVLTLWALIAFSSRWWPVAEGGRQLLDAPPAWVLWPVLGAAFLFAPYQAIRLLLLGKPKIPVFLELQEGPRYYSEAGRALQRTIRYIFRVPRLADWPEPRRLEFYCTGEMADPALWAGTKPSTPSQISAGLTSFRVDLEPDTEKLTDGVELFVLYACWEPGVRIYKVEAC